MPSFHHEALLQLFRNNPMLAPDLLREALQKTLPEFTNAVIHSAELSDIQPAEYRADLVVLLLNDTAVLGIVVEAQLSRDDQKQFAWPAYVTNLRARIKCPVCLLVVTADESTARWASRTLEIGGGNQFTPWVLSPSAVPQITDATRATQAPELAVFSALAHGQGANVNQSVQIAFAAITASAGLDADRSKMYVDLILNALTEVARKALQAMNPANYEYQSEFAKRYVAEGEARGKTVGKAEGKAEILIKQLALRFGAISDELQTTVRGLSSAELDLVAERIFIARSIDEALNAG